MGTQNSSTSIMEALQHLENTSEEMTESVTKILELIYETLEKVKTVNESVSTITDDSKQLGNEIQIVDDAIRKVEQSNKNMVDNMKQVQDIMLTVTEGVQDSESTTKTMLNKYAETSRNVIIIENVVGKLVEELGTGGFMNINDIEKGMTLFIKAADTKEYKTEVSDVTDDGIFVQALQQAEDFFGGRDGKEKYEVCIIVNNAMYMWGNTAVALTKKDGIGFYKLMISGNPKVMHRRKYPRLSMTNQCKIAIKGHKNSYDGRMVNICAGGFAVSSREQEFADAIGKQIEVTIQGFDILNGQALKGIIIRCTNDEGRYVMGCRMPEDNVKIGDYVKSKLPQ